MTAPKPSSHPPQWHNASSQVAVSSDGPIHRWWDYCSTWIYSTTGFCLPLSLLFALNAQLAHLTWSEIAAQYLVGFLGCCSLAVVFGTILWLSAQLGTLLLRPTHANSNFFLACNTLVAGILVAYQLVRGVRDWLYQTFHISFSLKQLSLFAFFCLVLIGAYLTMRRNSGVHSLIPIRLSRTLNAGREPCLLLLAISLVLLFAGGGITRVPDELSHAGRPTVIEARNGPAGHKPNILLITMDALCASHMSLYGYSLPTTPHLVEFGSRSYVFERFYANSNMTTPAVASIHLGTRPWQHKVFRVFGSLQLNQRSHTIAQLLHQDGYETSAFIANPAAHPSVNVFSSGYDYLSPELLDLAEFKLAHVGIDKYPAISMIRLQSIFPFSFVWSFVQQWQQITGSINGHWYDPHLVFDATLKYLDRQPGRALRPFFSWIHIFPPHHPYVAGNGFLYRFLPDHVLQTYADQVVSSSDFYPASVASLVNKLSLRYDEHIAYADDELESFLNRMEVRGLLNRTIVIISADHGEMFEKHFYHHGGPYLFEPLIHVPLLIHLPGQQKGMRIKVLAEQVDLLPTILELAGLPVPNRTEGRSLVPLLDGRDLPPHPVFSMNFERNSAFGALTQGTVAMIEGDYKYIHYMGMNKIGRRDELFNLKNDPEELTNLSPSASDVATTMRSDLLSRLHDPTIQPHP